MAVGLSEDARDAINSDAGLWRCHAAFECTVVCPSNVDPADKIMDLRRRMTIARARGALGLAK